MTLEAIYFKNISILKNFVSDNNWAIYIYALVKKYKITLIIFYH